MSNTRILLCQNDAQGRITDRCVQITFDINSEIALHLFSVDLLGGTLLQVNNTRITYRGMHIPYTDSKEWVGNIFWNMYCLPEKYFLGFANLVMNSGEWNIEQGWSGIWDKWKNKEPLTWLDFELDEPVEPSVINPAQLKLFS